MGHHSLSVRGKQCSDSTLATSFMDLHKSHDPEPWFQNCQMKESYQMFSEVYFHSKGLWLKFSERAGRNMTTAQSLSSHSGLFWCISLHVSLYKTENTKAQKMRTMETHKHTQALTENTVIPKEGACERPTTIPIKAHFQTVDSSLITSHFYTDK